MSQVDVQQLVSPTLWIVSRLGCARWIPKVGPMWFEDPGPRANNINGAKVCFGCGKHVFEVRPRGYICPEEQCFVWSYMVLFNQLFSLRSVSNVGEEDTGAALEE